VIGGVAIGGWQAETGAVVLLCGPAWDEFPDQLEVFRLDVGAVVPDCDLDVLANDARQNVHLFSVLLHAEKRLKAVLDDVGERRDNLMPRHHGCQVPRRVHVHGHPGKIGATRFQRFARHAERILDYVGDTLTAQFRRRRARVGTHIVNEPIQVRQTLGRPREAFAEQLRVYSPVCGLARQL